MMHLTVKSVIFDMDGVITDTMPYHFRVWKEIFAEEGVTVTHEDIYKREGQKGIQSVKEIFAEYRKPYSLEHAHVLLKRKEERFKQVFKRRFITGSRSFIRQLHRQGFRLALVTGTSRHEAVKLLPADLFDLFHVSVCGCEVVNGKPHPEPYLTALKKMSLLSKDGVVVENAPFGIRSAKAAGLKCLAIETSLPKNYLKEADGVFHSFKDLNDRVSISKG